MMTPMTMTPMTTAAFIQPAQPALFDIAAPAPKPYQIPLYTIRLVREGTQTGDRTQIGGPRHAADVARAVLDGFDREALLVLMLDTKNKIIGVNTCSVGDLSSSIVNPREVFKPAILASAAGIILAHNHPSGDPTPSSEDIAVTRRIVQAGELLGIDVLDHVIIGDPGFVSLKERGHM